MKFEEHKIVQQVMRSRQDPEAADQLIRSYMPFIKAETARFIHRPPVEGRDDELSVAMFAFYETMTVYNPDRGPASCSSRNPKPPDRLFPEGAKAQWAALLRPACGGGRLHSFGKNRSGS